MEFVDKTKDNTKEDNTIRLELRKCGPNNIYEYCYEFCNMCGGGCESNVCPNCNIFICGCYGDCLSTDELKTTNMELISYSKDKDKIDTKYNGEKLNNMTWYFCKCSECGDTLTSVNCTCQDNCNCYMCASYIIERDDFENDEIYEYSLNKSK